MEWAGLRTSLLGPPTVDGANLTAWLSGVVCDGLFGYDQVGFRLPDLSAVRFLDPQGCAVGPDDGRFPEWVLSSGDTRFRGYHAYRREGGSE
jgi:hypothetical protein